MTPRRSRHNWSSDGAMEATSVYCCHTVSHVCRACPGVLFATALALPVSLRSLGSRATRLLRVLLEPSPVYAFSVWASLMCAGAGGYRPVRVGHGRQQRAEHGAAAAAAAHVGPIPGLPALAGHGARPGARQGALGHCQRGTHARWLPSLLPISSNKQLERLAVSRCHCRSDLAVMLMAIYQSECNLRADDGGCGKCYRVAGGL